MRLNSLVASVVGLVAVLGCKPKAADSSLSAIVGEENGQRRALAIVAMRNAVESTDDVNNEAVERAIYERYYGLVECRDSNVKGKQVKADAWMNALEFYSLAGILYLDKDRNIVIYEKRGQELQPSYLPCGVAGRNLLTLPALLSVANETAMFPLDKPDDRQVDGLKDQYLMIQSVYLAMRGPHTDGKFNLSTSIIGMAQTSQSYPAMAFSETEIAKAMQGADPYYNPCIGAKKGADYPYMFDWKREFYSCVPSSLDPKLKNYRPGGKYSYTQVRERLKGAFASVYAETIGRDTGAVARLRATLMSTTPWKAAGALGRALSGEGRLSEQLFGGIGFGLTSDAESVITDGDVGFSLGSARGSTKGTSAATYGMTPQDVALVRNYFANTGVNPNFADVVNGKTYMRNLENSSEWAQIMRQNTAEYTTKMNRLNELRQQSLKAKPTERAVIEREYGAEVAGLNQRYAAFTMGQGSFTKAGYSKQDGVEGLMSTNGKVYFSKAGTELTEFTNAGKLTGPDGKEYTMWNDLTAVQPTVTKLANGTSVTESSPINQRLAWQEKGVGGQLIKTDNFNIVSSFQGNKQPDGTFGHVGKFYLDPKQEKFLSDQISGNFTAIDKSSDAAYQKAIAQANNSARSAQTAVEHGQIFAESSHPNAAQYANDATKSAYSSYWNQISSGWAATRIGASQIGASQNVYNQLDKGLDAGHLTNDSAALRLDGQAKTSLATNAADGLYKMYEGAGPIASGTYGAAKLTYDTNPYFKGAADYVSNNTTVGALWNAGSAYYNNLGGTNAPAPANNVPPPSEAPPMNPPPADLPSVSNIASMESSSPVMAGESSMDMSSMALQGSEDEADCAAVKLTGDLANKQVGGAGKCPPADQE